MKPSLPSTLYVSSHSAVKKPGKEAVKVKTCFNKNDDEALFT